MADNTANKPNTPASEATSTTQPLKDDVGNPKPAGNTNENGDPSRPDLSQKDTTTPRTPGVPTEEAQSASGIQDANLGITDNGKTADGKLSDYVKVRVMAGKHSYQPEGSEEWLIGKVGDEISIKRSVYDVMRNRFELV